MGEYRTIVADPPWVYGKWGNPSRPARTTGGPFKGGAAIALPYPVLTVAGITALPVRDLATPDAHLYLWTTNRYLEQAFGIVRAWGFQYAQTLVWAKTPMGRGPGGAFAQNAEYVLFARRGTLPHTRRQESVWFNWKRTGQHSRKPDAFLDLVEQVSPGPYLELFARRQRLGWSVWGNEVESSIEMAAD